MTDVCGEYAWACKYIPDLPVPYIQYLEPSSQLPIYQVTRLDPWLQIYRELEDEGMPNGTTFSIWVFPKINHEILIGISMK